MFKNGKMLTIDDDALIFDPRFSNKRVSSTFPFAAA